MLTFIDGYNLLHHLKLTGGPLESNRRKLLEFLSHHQQSALTIVFEGQEPEEAQHFFDQIEVIFTAKKISADQWIEEKIPTLKNPQDSLVVTNDRQLSTRCSHERAQIVSQDEFLQRLLKKKRLIDKEKRDDESPAEIERLEKIFSDRLNQE